MELPDEYFIPRYIGKAIVVQYPNEFQHNYEISTEVGDISVPKLSTFFHPTLDNSPEIEIFLYKSMHGETVVETVPNYDAVIQILLANYCSKFCGTIVKSDIIENNGKEPYLLMHVRPPNRRFDERIVAFGNEIDAFSMIKRGKTFIFDDIFKNTAFSGYKITPTTKIIPYANNHFPRLTTLEDFQNSENDYFLLRNNLSILAMVLRVKSLNRSRNERNSVTLVVGDKKCYTEITVFGSYDGLESEYSVGKFILIFHMTQKWQAASKDVIVLNK